METPMPPRPLLSTAFSGKEFPADADATVSERPYVSLHEWWLKRVDGDDRKLAVGGIFERNHKLQEYSSAPIAQRLEPCVLQTEDGSIVDIYGKLNIQKMLDGGFEKKVCEVFVLGFPLWWEDYNLLYPKKMEVDTGFEPNSSNASNSQEDSTKFYLEQYQLGKSVDLLSSLISDALKKSKGFSDNDADAIRNSSHLPNGAPRFEEYTSDDDTLTTERAAATNVDTERHATVCNEVDNVEMDFIESSTLAERDHGDTDANVSLAAKVGYTHDEANRAARNTPHKSKVASLSRDCGEKPQHIALTVKAVPDENMPTSACSDMQSQKARESSLLSMSTPESLKLRKSRSGRVIVPTLIKGGSQRIVYNPDGLISGVVGLDSPPLPKGSNTSKTYARKKKRAH